MSVLDQTDIKNKLINKMNKISQTMYCIQLEMEECKCLARLRAKETDQIENNTKIYDIQSEVEKLRKELEVIKNDIK